MKKYIHRSLLGFSTWLLLSCIAASADISPIPQTSEVKYHRYYYPDRFKTYHRFLPSPAPEDLLYHTRMIATANIDDTLEKESIVLIVVDTECREPFGNWHQAFLLITDLKRAVPKKKAFFKLFDSGTHKLETSAKIIELHSPPFIFKDRLSDAPWKPHGVSFRLADLTGDGTLDVWVESAYGVALISFQNGEFKEVFSSYTVTRQKLAKTFFDTEYDYYDAPLEPQGRLYHRFLSAPLPEGLYYNTRMTATANIDDTPEKETVVLMVADTGIDGPNGEWVQAFLLIAETEADVLKKKDFFKFFDTGTYALEVPAKAIEVHYPPFVFTERIRKEPWMFKHVFFTLVDLTGDGILDVWVESAYGVIVISFQNGEFKEICSGYTSIRSEEPIEYIDMDNDGIYEIEIPNIIYVKGVPGASYPEWMSLYTWNGTMYVLDNPKYYTRDDDILIQLLSQYNGWLNQEAALILYQHQPSQQRGLIGYAETCEFYIGMALYYRGEVPRAKAYLQRVATEGENKDYIEAAASILRKLSNE